MASFVLRRSIYATVAARSRSSGNWICARRQMSSSSSSPAPWLLIEDGANNNFYNFYSIADQSVKQEPKDGRAKDGIVVGSSHGWLALYKRRLDLFEMFLYNPRSKRYVDHPTVEGIPIPSYISPISKDVINRPTKLILTCSPDNKDNCRAIMSSGPEDKLSCCSPGFSNEWTFFPCHEQEFINEQHTKHTWFPKLYKDFVYSSSQKKLFCITKFDNYECWDLQDPLSPKMNWRIGGETRSDCQWVYLVFAEQINRLFVVFRAVSERVGPDCGRTIGLFGTKDGPYLTVNFVVYELIVDSDERGGKLRRMEGTLDGMAFFIGSTGHGFVLGDDDDEMMIKNVKPNSIYFTDPKELTPLPWDEDVVTHGGHDLGIFDYENRAFSSCYYPADIRNVKKRIEPTPTWFMPSTTA